MARALDPVPLADCSRSSIALSLELVRARLQRDGRTTLRVRGYSMWPILLPGAAVTVAVCPIEALRPGDVVLFEQAGVPVLHRLVAKRGAGWICRGDNRTTEDLPFPDSAVLGRMTGIPVGRRALPGSPGAQRVAHRVLSPGLRCVRLVQRPLALLRRVVVESRA